MAKISFVKNIGNIKKRVGFNALLNLKAAMFLYEFEADAATPRDEGKLIDRKQRRIIQISPNLFYGSFTYLQDEYAEVQHETLTFNHPRQGEARWLPRTIERHGQRMLALMGRGIIS